MFFFYYEEVERFCLFNKIILLRWDEIVFLCVLKLKIYKTLMKSIIINKRRCWECIILINQ